MKPIKYVLAFALALALVISLVACKPATENPTEDSGIWQYTIGDDGTATLTLYLANEENVEIPAAITAGGNTYKVTALGEGVFVVTGKDGVYGDNTTLKTVTFAEGSEVVAIQNRAFYQCVALENVNLPSCIKSIGDFSFYGCDSLSSFYFPQNVESIGAYAFRECPNLKSVYITSVLAASEDKLDIPAIGEKCFYLINKTSKKEDRYYLADDFKIYVSDVSAYDLDRLESFRKATKLDYYKAWAEYEGHFEEMGRA